MPRARERTAVRVKPGRLRSSRAAQRKSDKSDCIGTSRGHSSLYTCMDDKSSLAVRCCVTNSGRSERRQPCKHLLFREEARLVRGSGRGLAARDTYHANDSYFVEGGAGNEDTIGRRGQVWRSDLQAVVEY